MGVAFCASALLYTAYRMLRLWSLSVLQWVELCSGVVKHGKNFTEAENVCPEKLVEAFSEASRSDLRECRFQNFTMEAWCKTPGVSPRNLIHSFLQTFFAGSWPWLHHSLPSVQGPPTSGRECSSRRKLPKKPEMESLQSERTVFYIRLYKKAKEQAIQHWLALFYSQLQQPPFTVTQSGAPTHLPLSHSFWPRRTYLKGHVYWHLLLVAIRAME